MLIIDSLLLGNRLFLFGSGVENPFSFCFSRKNRQVCLQPRRDTTGSHRTVGRI
jgi:hypothetical protein